MIIHSMKLAHFGPHDKHNMYGVDAYAYQSETWVILHELLWNNDGTSITHAFDNIATDLARWLLETGVITAPECIRWIEHYPDRTPMGYVDDPELNQEMFGESWDIVEMDWYHGDGMFHSPRWRPCGNRRSLPDPIAHGSPLALFGQVDRRE